LHCLLRLAVLAEKSGVSTRRPAVGAWASALALCHVLHVFRQRYPGMHPFFIDRDRRRRKARVCEGADGNGNTVFAAFRDEVDRGAASRAERESGPSAFVADKDMFRACTADFDCLARKPGLRRKDAPASTLACEAMADSYADRISRDSGGEPAATARRDSKCHDNVEKSSSDAWLPVCPTVPAKAEARRVRQAAGVVTALRHGARLRGRRLADVCRL